jgi:hypothetical protein
MTAGAADVSRIATFGRIAVGATGRLRERDLAQAGEVVATLAISVGYRHQLTIRVSLRLLAATRATIAMRTTAPTAIQTHGTLLVVVVVVVPFVVVVLSVVVAELLFGAVFVLEPPVVAGPVVVVVVL